MKAVAGVGVQRGRSWSTDVTLRTIFQAHNMGFCILQTCIKQTTDYDTIIHFHSFLSSYSECYIKTTVS